MTKDILYRDHVLTRATGTGYWSTRCGHSETGRYMADTLDGLKELVCGHDCDECWGLCN